MGLDKSTICDVARELAIAESKRQPIDRIATRFPNLTVEDAIQIAEQRDTFRVDDGFTRVGYKLGWTSKEMRAALGIGQPNWGTIWDYMRVESTVSAARFIHAKAEPELAFIATKELSGEVSKEEVLYSDGYWALAIEIVDPRWPSFEFTFEENTADNSSSAAFVLGQKTRLPADPGSVDVLFSSNEGNKFGSGENAMGSPAEAVSWFCSRLAQFGKKIEPGDIVLTGGLTGPVDVYPGQSLSISSSLLNTISLQVKA